MNKRLALWIVTGGVALGLVGVALVAGWPSFHGTKLEVRLKLVKHRVMSWLHEPARCSKATIPLRAVDVVLIAVDTLRADHLGVYNYERAVSPNLDGLARDSVVFERAIASAPWTTPSFAGVMTGYHPGALGITTEPPRPLPREIPTLAEALCEAGYQTAGVVSHLYVGMEQGFNRGFEEWDQSNSGGHAWVSSAKVTGKVLEYLERFGEQASPFFLFAHYFDPHYDFREHRNYKFSQGYSGKLRSEGDNFAELQKLAQSGALDDDDIQYLRDSYDSEIAFTDHHIGRVLDALKQKGLYEDALIVFVADHGEAFAERPDRWIGHAKDLYKEALHVPLFFKLPNREGRGRFEPLVSTVDVAPTILDILRYPPSASPVADPDRSLLRMTGAPAGLVFSQTRNQGSKDAVMDQEWKLIRDTGSNNVELFDLSTDQEELSDVGSQHPQVVAHLEALLTRWLSELERQSRSLREAQPAELSEEEIERLRGLGYLN